MEGYHYGYNWLMMLFTLIFSAVCVGAVVFLIVWLVGRTKPGGGENPLDILKTRYAKGEITKEEYERMKQDLS